MPASLVIGQTDFTHNVSVASQTNFNGPSGLVFDASGNLWVADQQNNRVLIFEPPFSNGKAASLVIGQVDFVSSGISTTQTGLNGPFGLGFDSSGNLWVSDSGNNRVLMFKPPFSTGMAASLVIGQTDFVSHVSATTQTGLNGPFGLGFDSSGNLWVADAFNNRVLMFKPPFSNGKAASLVIGQTDFVSSGSATTQTGLSEPSGLVFDASGGLWVADAFNDRVLMFKSPFSNGKAASLVIGQVDFVSGGIATTQTGLKCPSVWVLMLPVVCGLLIYSIIVF